jgi:O-antigen/teichoic acid export membrane protein
LAVDEPSPEAGGILGLARRLAGGVFLVTMFGQAAAFGVQLLLARTMGVEGFGIYVYVFTWLMIASVVVPLGQARVMLRFVSAYRAEGQMGRLRGVIRNGHKLVGRTCVGVGLGVALAILVVGGTDNSLRGAALVACAALPVVAWKNLQLAIAHSLRQVVLAKGMDELGIRIGLVLCFLGLWGVQGRAPGAAQTLLLLGGVSVAVGLWVRRAWRSELGEERTGPREDQSSLWFRTGVGLVLLDGMAMLLSRTDIVLLGVLRDTTDAGTYAIASRLATLALLGLMVVQAPVIPLLSERFATGRMGEFLDLTRWAARVAAGLSLGLAVVLLVGADWLLGLFGPEFLARKDCLVVLTVGLALNATLGPTGTVLWITGREKQLAVLQGAGLALNILLNLWWVPRFGIVGAAWATVVSHTAWNVWAVVRIRAEFGFTTLPVGWLDAADE